MLERFQLSYCGYTIVGNWVKFGDDLAFYVIRALYLRNDEICLQAHIKQFFRVFQTDRLNKTITTKLSTLWSPVTTPSNFLSLERSKSLNYVPMSSPNFIVFLACFLSAQQTQIFYLLFIAGLLRFVLYKRHDIY